MSLGKNIRKKRIALGLSQQKLADAMGYRNRSSITKIEKDQSPVTGGQLQRLAQILHTTVGYLANDEPETELPKGIIIPDPSVLNPPEQRRSKQRCVAVVLAGGKKHMNVTGIPFQFVTVREKPVILYTMEAFQRHPQIDGIVAVCLNGWEDYLSAYAEKEGITKLLGIVPGGSSGVNSLRNAVEWLATSADVWDILIVQDGTSPFVDPETVSNAIRCCRQYGSAVTFERMDPVTPFLLNGSDTEKGLSHLPAERLINVKSPECYNFGLLRQAFHDADRIGLPCDETICAVFLYHLGRELRFCEGHPRNYRVVSAEDLKVMEALL